MTNRIIQFYIKNNKYEIKVVSNWSKSIADKWLQESLNQSLSCTLCFQRCELATQGPEKMKTWLLLFRSLHLETQDILKRKTQSPRWAHTSIHKTLSSHYFTRSMIIWWYKKTEGSLLLCEGFQVWRTPVLS